MRIRGASILSGIYIVLFALIFSCAFLNPLFAQTPQIELPGTPNIPGVPSLPGVGHSEEFEEVGVNATINCAPGCRKPANEKTVKEVNKHFQKKRIELERYLVSDIYRERILPALQHFAEQWTVGEQAALQMSSNLTDAEITADTVNTMRQEIASVTAEVQVDEGFCAQTTARAPLVAASVSSQDAARAISEQSQISDSAGNIGEGGIIDYRQRLIQTYLGETCNRGDFNGALAELCNGQNPDADINFDALIQSVGNPLTENGSPILSAYVGNVTGSTPIEQPPENRAGGEEYTQIRIDQERLAALEANARSSVSNVLANYLPGQNQINSFVQASFDQTGINSQDGHPSFMNLLRTNVNRMRSPDTLAGETMVHERALLAQHTANSGLQLSIYDQYHQSLIREVRNMSAAVGQMVYENAELTRENLINATSGEERL